MKRIIPTLTLSMCFLVLAAGCKKKKTDPSDNYFKADIHMINEEKTAKINSTGANIQAARAEWDGMEVISIEAHDNSSPQKFGIQLINVSEPGTYLMSDNQISAIGSYYKDSTKIRADHGDLYVITNVLTGANDQPVYPMLKFTVTEISSTRLKGKIECDMYNYTTVSGGPDIDWKMELRNGEFDIRLDQ